MTGRVVIVYSLTVRSTWIILLFLPQCMILFPTSLAADVIRPQIGVYYFPGWCRSGEAAKPPFDKANDVTEWRSVIAKAPYPRALLGFYDDSDPRLWSYYLNWMKADGIDFIAFDWYYNAGQQYLEQIARALGQAEQRPILPTKEEMASWSMLHPDEIEAARKNESKPWPQHEPKWFQFGQNEAVPNVRMPVVIDFGTNGISFKNIFLNHMTVLDRNDSAVTLLHEGDQDSGIEINTQKIPMAQIKSIQIEVALTGDSSPEQLQGEFFWSTSYMPQFSPYCSIPVVVRRNRSIELSTDEMPGWNESGTPLTRIRIDFGKRPHVAIRLQRVVLRGWMKVRN